MTGRLRWLGKGEWRDLWPEESMDDNDERAGGLGRVARGTFWLVGLKP
jgi:hypothetical protein